MKKQILIALFCLAILQGCDDSEPDFEQHYVSENLVIGDLNATGLVYVDFSPDTVLDPQPGEQILLDLDVNGDDTSDLRLFTGISSATFIFANSGLVGSLTATMEISSELVTYTSYYYSQLINDTVRRDYFENFSTSQPPNSSINNYQLQFPISHHVGDTIDNNVSDWNGSMDLSRKTVGMDTSGHTYYTYDLRFSGWSDAGPRYAVFRFIKSREVYYGWIKLEVTDYTKIVVDEYAYRKITEI